MQIILFYFLLDEKSFGKIYSSGGNTAHRLGWLCEFEWPKAPNETRQGGWWTTGGVLFFIRSPASEPVKISGRTDRSVARTFTIIIIQAIKYNKFKYSRPVKEDAPDLIQ